MDADHLFRYSKSYSLLKGVTSFYHSIYYEEICILNPENIPVNKPVIFAANHQNGLMDALALVYTTGKQPVFMARADIFKKDFIRKILTFLKIVPVYRMHDGIETLTYNDESFEITIQVLKQNGAVGIMPEGNHGDQRRLRPLKKGIARLALQSQELLTQDVMIVPVGIDYSSYQGFRGNLMVNFGEPVAVKDYLQEYKQNAPKGLQSLRNRITRELKGLMIDIDSDEYYSIIYEAKELYSFARRDERESFCDKFLLDKKVSDMLVRLATHDPGQIQTLRNRIMELNDSVSRLHLSSWILSWNPPRTRKEWIFDLSRYIFSFPVFILAALFHAVPYFVSEVYANRVEDKQFVSSIRFVASFIMYLVWYFLILILPYSILLKIIILITMPVLGVISFDFWDSLKRARQKYLYFRLKKLNRPLVEKLSDLHNEIIDWISARLDGQKS